MTIDIASSPTISVKVNTYVTPEDAVRLRDAAEADGRSMAGYVRRAIRASLDADDDARAGA